jgi:DNA replication and repair protein RecF
LHLKSLHIENLRNIELADLTLSKNINIIQGSNGAGKTSLLEAMYMLARAKTFRQTTSRSIIAEHKNSLTLFSEANTEQDETIKVGLIKQGSKLNIKINGEKVSRLSDLATIFPISLINPQSHRIIEEGPDNRRRLLNWGVFHVEHRFRFLASKYQRVLQQRNSALRLHEKNLSIWDEQLVSFGEQIAESHSRYITMWVDTVRELVSKIPYLSDIEMTYHQGWETNKSLIESLNEHQALDFKRGYTTPGPHRSEIHISIDGKGAKYILSRGQQKVLVTLLLIAQSRLLFNAVGEKAVFLVDDLAAELDRNSQNLILQAIRNEACQAVITTLDFTDLPVQQIKTDNAPKMFHVEHGMFKVVG